MISKGNKALTVKADPRSESGSDSGTGPDLSPSGGEPFRLDIGKSFSCQCRLQNEELTFCGYYGVCLREMYG